MQKLNDGTVFETFGRSSNPCVVLIHGLGLTRATWDQHVAAFQQNYFVVAYDLLGHGESALPPEKPSLTTYANQIKNLLDALKIERAALVGFSLGGMINRRFAMDYPERVSVLGILNSPHERGEAEQQLVEQRAADTSAGGVEATIDATLERWFTKGFRVANIDAVEKVKQSVLANDPEAYTECRWVLANGVLELIRPNPPIEHPTLVITGENDSGSTPAMSRAIASEIKGAETLIISELQHMGLVERPELFTKPLIEFLKKHV